MELNTLFSAVNIGSGNVFENMRNGIIAEFVDFSVHKSRFSNMTVNDEYELTGYGIYVKGRSNTFVQRGLGNNPGANTPSIQRCNVGIYTHRVHTYIRDNNMVEVNTGIQVENGPNMIIDLEDNYIACKRLGIYLWQNDRAFKLLVANNDIAVNPSGGTGKAIGIFVNEVYPNPANEQIICSYQLPTTAQLSIHNLMGQKVYETNLANGSNQKPITTTDWQEGIYLYQIFVENKLVYHDKIVIIH